MEPRKDVYSFLRDRGVEEDVITRLIDEGVSKCILVLLTLTYNQIFVHRCQS